MKSKLYIAMASIVIFVFSCGTPAPCAVVSTRACLTSLVDTDVFEPELPPIEVGCEAIDCCKGCPGPPFEIEWQITIEGDGVAGAVFDFHKLQRSAASGLKPLSGAVKLDHDRLAVERGKSIITGFATDGKRSTGTTAKLSLRPSRDAIAAMLKKALSHHKDDKHDGEDHSQDPLGIARVRVDQLVGSRVVNQLVLEVEFVPCLSGEVNTVPCPQPEWESVGPDHISGAMREIVVDPANHNRLYAVSANGGLWRLGDVRGYPDQRWRPLTDRLSDNISSMNVPLTPGVNHLRFRTLAVAPSAPGILYAANSIKELLGTSNVYSELYRSSNGGFSWQAIHDPNLGVINRILIHPSNANVVYLATSTGFWKQPGTIGTWTQLRSDDCLDAELDPDDSSIIYVGVRGQGVFKSFTSGSDWSPTPIVTLKSSLTDPCCSESVSGQQFIELALGRRNADNSPQTPVTRTVVARMGVEICVHNAAGEGGESTWQRVIPCFPKQPTDPTKPLFNDDLKRLDGGASGRSDDSPRKGGEWSNCLDVDPFDPKHILVGGDGLLESTDGGLTWTRIGGLHEDEHCIAFDPDPNAKGLVYLANDGGVFSSINGGTSWPNMSLGHITPASNRGLNLAKGLVTSEFRHSVVRSGRCFAAIDHTGFILSNDFENRWQFLFNSAEDAQAHAHEGSLIFASPASLDQYFVINNRASDDPLTTSTTSVVDRIAQFDFTRSNGLVDPPAFQFLSTDIAALPATSGYFPDTMIYQQHVRGPMATTLSGNNRRIIVGASSASPTPGFVLRSFLMPATGVTVTSATTEQSSTQPFFAMTFAPDNPDRAFAMTRNGQLFERDFSTSTPMAPLGTPWAFPHGDQFVSRLVAVAQPTLTLYSLSQHGLGRFDFGTSTWTTLQTWSPVDTTLLAFAVQPGKPGTLYLGTSQGVYIKEGIAEWNPYTRNLPPVPVTELSFDDGYLYAATLGRGLWRCKPCR